CHGRLAVQRAGLVVLLRAELDARGPVGGAGDHVAQPDDARGLRHRAALAAGARLSAGDRRAPMPPLAAVGCTSGLPWAALTRMLGSGSGSVRRPRVLMVS